MKRRATVTMAILAVLLIEGAAGASAQTAFSIPFPFQAGGSKRDAAEVHAQVDVRRAAHAPP